MFEPASDMVNGRALLQDARKDVAVRSAAQQQRGESACLADLLVSFVGPSMSPRFSFVFFAFFVAVFALQCLNRRNRQALRLTLA